MQYFGGEINGIKERRRRGTNHSEHARDSREERRKMKDPF